jgi:SAM-dependent methyltransferase
MALDIAPHCRSVTGYDRTAAWIALAEQAAQARGLTNTTFICYDSSAETNGGQPRVPAPDNAFDLLICSKGPFHWIEDARRIARPGAVLLMLVPDATPLTEWTAALPEPLRWTAGDLDWARPAIERRLALAGLSLHSWWSFDVPEVFPDAEALYAWRAWGYTPEEVPAYRDVAAELERIFARYADADGLQVRRRRYLWRAVVPGEEDTGR